MLVTRSPRDRFRKWNHRSVTIWATEVMVRDYVARDCTNAVSLVT